jgi:pyruvate dehydrogenase E2 component (dihydrolipoamide acetyltransferase)
VAVVNVKVGDVIAAGAAVCEVETDKAVAEINCPHAGTITAVHVKPGTTIPIGEVLVDIRTTSGGGVAAPAASAPAPSAAIAATTTTAEAASPASPAVSPVATTGAGASVGKTADNRPPAPAGPATRRLARKLGVDLYQVKGSAAGGRITIEDIEAYVRERLKQPTLPSAASAPGFGIVAAAPLPDFSKFGPIEKQPMNKIFRVAAASLHAAWVTIPHVTQHDLADITELEAARKRYVKSNPNAPKITMTAIMIKAVVGALKAFPNVNSSVDMQSGEMIIKHYYHIGVAVDTPNGLVVPVIRNCDQKNVLQVAAELGEIATRARDRKLKTEDMQGATFTITNLGGIGGTAFTPIVNYPEVAILGLSRGITQLVLEEGQVTERLMLPLSLSYDHRAINGADAARFIVKLSSSLSNFFELF